MLSALAAIVLLALTLVGALAASGDIWILVSVLFLGGVQLISIGILGRYLARVHEESLQRPLYLVEQVISPRADGAASRPEPPAASPRSASRLRIQPARQLAGS